MIWEVLEAFPGFSGAPSVYKINGKERRMNRAVEMVVFAEF